VPRLDSFLNLILWQTLKWSGEDPLLQVLGQKDPMNLYRCFLGISSAYFNGLPFT